MLRVVRGPGWVAMPPARKDLIDVLLLPVDDAARIKRVLLETLRRPGESLEVRGKALWKSCGRGAADGPESLAERGHSIARVEELGRGQEDDTARRTQRDPA